MRSTLFLSVVVILFASASSRAQMGDSPFEAPPRPIPGELTTGTMTAQPGTSELILTQGTAGAMTTPAGAAADSGGQSDNGTNPAQNITTFIASNEYYTLQGGNRINTTYTRLKFPFYDKRASILLEVPFVYYDLRATNPNLPTIGGLGDIKLQMSYNTWTSCDKKLTVINFFEAFLPTADNALAGRELPGNSIAAFNLGTGKYVLGAGGGFVYAFAPNFIVAPIYFYEASAFGNENRPDIRRGKFRGFLMYAWESGLYTLPEFQALTNYKTGSTDFYVAPEVGYSHKGATFYTKPGIGIDRKPGERQWGLEFGARVQF